jgi:hypothetical protein
MSVNLSVRGYSSKDNAEFKKHYNAVKFCIENGLSYPVETSAFFKGRVDGDDLEDFEGDESILESIENGIAIPLKLHKPNEWTIKIKVSEIPVGVDTIIATIES